MKKALLKLSLLSFVMCFAISTVAGQNVIELDPSSLEPHDDGYYVAGVWVDEDDDGVDEFHNGCEDYFEDEPPFATGYYNPHLNHNETGTQQSFYYQNCMIMPDCEHKSEPIEPPVATGYIQMHACLFTGTDSAKISYIQSPAIQNLTSIYMETSSDVSINESRTIPYNIEYSIDGGTTWEETYFMDVVEKQGGFRVTYDGSVNLEIQEMIDASNEGAIVIRIITNDRSAPTSGQFVKLHSLKLTADIASGIDKSAVVKEFIVTINNRTISVADQLIEVYNPMGQLVGKGSKVEIPQSGIYFVRNNQNSTKKVYVE